MNDCLALRGRGALSDCRQRHEGRYLAGDFHLIRAYAASKGVDLILTVVH